MKDTIFSMLKQAYSPLGLGDAILMAHAEMLDSLGYVTPENVGDVVAKQKNALEQLQKANDTRVGDALAKQAKELAKKREDEQKALEEQRKREADEAARKAAEEDAKRASTGLSPELKEYLEKMEEARQARYEEERKASESAHQAEIKKLMGDITALKTENDAAKAAKAKADHEAKILSKAKELNIPQYRIDEGFNLPEDADDSTISAYLGNVAKNIQTNQLPAAGHMMFGDGKPNKEEVDSIAAELIRKV